jgi:transposase
MPWKETTSMTLRTEFTALARGQGVSVSELARRFGISRKTAYKWLARASTDEPLSDRSRRPRTSPTRTDEDIAQALVELRRAHPCWGGRKLHQVLLDRGHTDVPAASTITHILRRHGLIPQRTGGHGGTWKRFEHASPNDL